MNLKRKLKSIMSDKNCARPLAGISLWAWLCRNFLAVKACAIFSPISKRNSINFHLAAATIAAIYKDRWQVELFFKAIKQNLKIKAFVGTSRNAVLTQIWIAMITYLLLAFARHSAKVGWTVQRIMRVIQLNLFDRRSLKSILMPDPPDHKKANLK